MNWANKNVLITGVGGFLGSTLTKTLLKKHANIIGIDNFSYVKKEWSSDILDKIEFIRGDVSQKKVFEKVSDVDYIFHLSSPSSIVLFNKNPQRCYLETILSMWNVLELSKKRGVKKVIYPSSGSVYGGNEKPHIETIYPKPRNLYGAAKLACEAMASFYQPFVKSVGLRIFAGYGPGEERKGEFASVVYLFINDIINDRNPVIYGDGTQERDFIYVDDIINAMIQAAEIDFCGIINVGTGISTSFSKLIKIIQQTLGETVEVTYIPKRADYVESLQADTRLMKKLLNIEPIGIEEGIKKFVEYLKRSS